MHLIVGFPPGGAADITARLMGQWLSECLDQPFVIENRPGAGTNIGTEAVARAPAGGYTLLLVSVANTVNATLYEPAAHVGGQWIEQYQNRVELLRSARDRARSAHSSRRAPRAR